MHIHTQRVQPLDYMRGFAVILMVMGHSIDSVLSPVSRTTELFRFYDSVRGFTAPLFLFVSGFVFSVTTLRRWDAFVAFGAPARRRLTKMLMLLGLGYALHFPFFSLNKILYHTQPHEYALMFQVDILHCLAVTIIMLQVVVVLARTPLRFAWISAGIAGVVALLSPLIWVSDITRVVPAIIAPYFNQSVPSLFPLFPFSAYLFTGAAVGMVYLRKREAGTEELFLRRVIQAGLSLAVVGTLLDLQPIALYPPHDFWKAGPAFFLIRAGIVGAIAASAFRLRRLPPVVAENLAALGQSSLIVYTVHLVLVYGSVVNPGLMQIIGQRLDTAGAVVVALGVLTLMVTVVHVWKTLREVHYYPLRLTQAGFTTTLLYFFLTKPF